MNKKELREYFEKEFLKGTCFENLKELLKDKTDIRVNMPRALIGLELLGVWRGINRFNSIAPFDYVPKHDGD